MKRFVLVAIAVCFTIYMFGCAKKQEPFDESQEAMSMDQLTAQTQTTEVKAPMVEPLSAVSTESPDITESKIIKLEPLPPAGPYRPTTLEIQTALQNAGFYNGNLDGKRGKMTEEAIKEFQKASGLDVDGKVGPKTWAVLSQHLVVEPVLKKKSKKR